MRTERNEFLSHQSSDESDHDNGYDSEAAEVSKGASRTYHGPKVKRRKTSHLEEEADPAWNETTSKSTRIPSLVEQDEPTVRHESSAPLDSRWNISEDTEEQDDFKIKSASTALKRSQSNKMDRPKVVPGVVYLSSLPPYLKPSALRNILQQRGFEPISRLFLAPASKAKASSKKNSRQLYTEGWIEFASKKTARRCAESLNANIIGGKKGGFYYDDIWNMKYLKGMAWDELMAGIREERREEEGRRDEERRVIAKETQRFLEGVEEGKKAEGMKRKRRAKETESHTAAAEKDIKRTWRQFQVRGGSSTKKPNIGKLDDDVQAVLGKIF